MLSGEETTFDLVENLNNAISQTMSGTNITIRAKFPETIDLDEEIARFIYSTLKEGLNNGIRHGKSTAFLFELKFTDSELYFLLSDNGVGCESFKAGYGLSTMNKKIRELGGALTINTSKDEGFEIEFTLPLRIKDD